MTNIKLHTITILIGAALGMFDAIIFGAFILLSIFSLILFLKLILDIIRVSIRFFYKKAHNLDNNNKLNPNTYIISISCIATSIACMAFINNKIAAEQKIIKYVIVEFIQYHQRLPDSLSEIIEASNLEVFKKEIQLPSLSKSDITYLKLDNRALLFYTVKGFAYKYETWFILDEENMTLTLINQFDDIHGPDERYINKRIIPLISDSDNSRFENMSEEISGSESEVSPRIINK